ncbi:MAG: DNA topoisomerase IV subunit A [Erysipelotrichia bacterium]|nr:DNA topoisomerase IV subunit A [Erysipelotrichia bacterium]
MKKKIVEEKILELPLKDLISDRYGEYAKTIIQERALPDARDGLKPVQRRILYAMHKDGNTHEKAYRKSAKTVGLVIGNYHPHGDSSIYDAMVRLSQDWKVNHTLIEMHGNNGSIDDDPAAAMRYTEARLAEISSTLLEDIDKDTVIWTPNFDDTENEPTVLPARFPNLIVNGSTGIAAGYATNIPPHNLKEVIEGTVYRINNPNSTINDLMKIIKGPDFPTKGIAQGIDGIKEAFTTGRGRIVIRSKVDIEKGKGGIQQIVVREIPYEVIKTNIVKKIDDIRYNKELDGILDVRDESDRTGLRIVIDVKKDADANLILNYLYKNTDLQVYYNYNMVAIVNNRPMYLGLLDMLDAYIEFYKDFVLRRTKYEFDKRLNRCHILEGLIKAVSVLDEVIKIIRGSKDKADAKKNLIDRFQFTEAQAEAIVQLRLYRLTNTDIFALKDEYKQLVKEMRDLNEIINNPISLNKVLCTELTELKDKFSHERYTVIEDKIDEIVIDKIDMIANERVMVSFTKDGYVKKVSLRSYNSTESSLPGLKETDELIGYTEADSIDTLMAFTASGEYVLVPLYEIDESKWRDIGNHISDYVKVNNAEQFVSAYLVKDFDTYAWIITASQDGMIKRTDLNAWKLVRTSRSSLAMNLSGDDKVIDAKLAYADDEVLIVTKDGYGLRYSIDEIPNVSSRAKGVIAVRLSGEDKLASMDIISPNKTEAVFLTTKGNSKRIKLTDIQVTRRATKGLLIAKKNKTNPAEVKNVIVSSLSDDLGIISNNEPLDLKARDINLLSSDSRFSTSTIEDWYHYNGIEEIKIIDIPEQDEKKRI